jgi:hypothetical protein
MSDDKQRPSEAQPECFGRANCDAAEAGLVDQRDALTAQLGYIQHILSEMAAHHALVDAESTVKADHESDVVVRQLTVARAKRDALFAMKLRHLLDDETAFPKSPRPAEAPLDMCALCLTGKPTVCRDCMIRARQAMPEHRRNDAQPTAFADGYNVGYNDHSQGRPYDPEKAHAQHPFARRSLDAPLGVSQEELTRMRDEHADRAHDGIKRLDALPGSQTPEEAASDPKRMREERDHYREKFHEMCRELDALRRPEASREAENEWLANGFDAGWNKALDAAGKAIREASLKVEYIDSLITPDDVQEGFRLASEALAPLRRARKAGG